MKNREDYQGNLLGEGFGATIFYRKYENIKLYSNYLGITTIKNINV